MKFRTILLATACGLAVPVAATAAGPTPAPAAPLQVGKPSVKVVPVFQVTPPNQLPPANELPTAPFAVGLYSAILAQANDSNELPTSPPPPQSALPSCSGYQLNKYSWYWPSVTQSQTWWAAQPGAPAKGSEAYTIGIAISHQQQEGWQVTGGCVADPEPACSGAGYTSHYTWGGQFSGWGGYCNYQPQPSCPTGAGYTGSYNWNGSRWVSGCQYQSQPSCPTGAGYTGSYSWNGSSWVSGCQYQAQPSCPARYSGSYSWTGAAWVDNCVAPPAPSTPPASSPPSSNNGGSSSNGGGGAASSTQYYLYFSRGNTARGQGQGGQRYSVSQSDFDQVVASGNFVIDYADPAHNVANSADGAYTLPPECTILPDGVDSIEGTTIPDISCAPR